MSFFVYSVFCELDHLKYCFIPETFKKNLLAMTSKPQTNEILASLTRYDLKCVLHLVWNGVCYTTSQLGDTKWLISCNARNSWVEKEIVEGFLIWISFVPLMNCWSRKTIPTTWLCSSTSSAASFWWWHFHPFADDRGKYRKQNSKLSMWFQSHRPVNGCPPVWRPLVRRD